MILQILLGILVSTNVSASAGDVVTLRQATQMIEIDSSGESTLPFANRDGEDLVATPVVVEHYADGSVVARRLEERDPIGALFTTGVRLSTPLLLSVSFGVVIGPRHEGAGGSSGEVTGLLLQVEPGIFGGRASIGVATIFGPGRLLGLPIVVGGYGAKLSYLRTWNVSHPASYAGLEGDFELFFVKLTTGLFRRVAGDAAASNWRFSVGAGLGF